MEKAIEKALSREGGVTAEEVDRAIARALASQPRGIQAEVTGPTPTPVDVAGTVQSAVASVLAGQPIGVVTAEDVASAIAMALASQPLVTQDEVAVAIAQALAAQPAGVTRAEVGSAIAKALAAQPGVTAEQVARATPTPPPTSVPAARPTPTPAPPPAAVAVSTRLRTASFPQRETNDPALSTVGEASLQFRMMYETLTRLDENGGVVVPNLALRWESSSDSKTHTFFLKKGVQWHNGYGEFKAQDVKHSLERMTREDVLILRQQYVDMLRAVEVVDDYTVRFNFDPPVSLIDVIGPYGFNTELGLSMMSKAHFDALGQDGVISDPSGTGPYQYVGREDGVHVLYERVDGHHWVTPDFKEYQYLYVAESVTRLAMLLSDQVDAIFVAPDLQKTAHSRGMRSILATTVTTNAWMPFGGMYNPNGGT